MTSLLRLELPLPPSLNNAYTNGVHGRRVLSQDGRAFKLAAGLKARVVANQQQLVVSPGLYEFILVLHFKDRRRTDIDNRIKLCLDAVSEAIGIDDSRIGRIVVERGAIDKQRPHCEVTLQPWRDE